MKRKFISALLFGALCITPSSVLVSCDDYDSDIENLQQQITANAQTLEQLSGEKLKNVAAEIEALKAAQKGLEDAYKNADEANKQAVIAAAQALVDKAKADLESALDAANKRIDEQGKTVETLLKNDAEMQIAITTAKEKAEQAYGLAEQAKALSAANKEELTKVAENLKTIKETLESQINALGDQVSALAEKVGKLESALTAQEASLKAYVDAKNKEQDDKLNSLKDELNGKYDDLNGKYDDLNGKYDDLNGKYNELNGKYDDLFGNLGDLAKELEKFNGDFEAYKADQAKKIEALETSIANLKSEIATNRTELESLVQAEVKKLSDKIGAVESALNTKIEDLKTAYNNLDTKDKELQAQIDEIEKNLDNAQKTLNEEITKKINTVNGLVDVLFADLKSLITGVIVQDAESEFEAVYAQVMNYSTNPGEKGKTYFDQQPDAQNKLKVYFPYKDAKGAETLLQKQYNVQEKAGFFFATINPNTVDFNGQQLTLLNSQDNQPNFYKVEKAATANKLITRAAAKNGLYEMAVTNSFNKSGNVMEAPETNSKVVYALAAADTTTRGKDGEVLGRKVYSKYEIKLNATKATALNNADFELVGKGAEKGDGTVFNYRFSGTAATQGDLEGTLELKPFFDAHKAKGAAKVYRKYLVCTGAVKPMGKTTEAESKAAADAMNANKGFQAVLAEGDANFNEVPVIISEKYNGWIFTYDFYIWNYNGSILKNTYKVIYTRPMIETQTIAMTHTPQSNETQNVSESNPAFSSLLCMTSENEKFVKNAHSVHIGAATVKGTTIEGGEFTKVTFSNGKESALNTKTIVLNQNAASASFGDDFKASDLKTLTLTYDPSKVTYDKVYTLPISFKNPQGNLVNTVNVQFTMKRPTIWDVMIQRITNAFEGNITIAWAAYNKNAKGYAYYDLSGSYNNVNKDLDKVNVVKSKILFKDLTVYNKANKNEAYKPLKGDLGAYSAPFQFNHLLYVPNAAVDADSKGAKEAYLYNLEAGVKYFGLANLYAATEKFQLKWYSPIYHADLSTKELTIGYPGTLDVTNADITSDDPSKSGKQNIMYLENRDVRITHVEIKPIMNGNVFADANTGLFTKYQVSKDGKKIEFETTEKAALTGPATVKFHMVVTDVFGCVKTHELSVTVDPNEHHAQKK